MKGKTTHVLTAVRARIFKILIGLTGLVAAHGSVAGQVGTTTGAFEITAGGQSAYSMAIEVPPGIMGVVPQVAITYNSSGGNGLLGLGASLSGLSSISRCGKTFAQDGVAQAVQFNSKDYFCLNGQRLILMSGSSYGVAGSTYQTEIESFQRVTAKGSVGDGPAYFEVLAKGGSKLVFGNSLSGTHLERPIDPITGFVASWGISYLEDKHGNRVIYEYEDAGRTEDGVQASQILPSRITYGHNTNVNSTTELAVEFVYQARPDISRGYLRGQKYIRDVRLGNIETRVDGALVKDYRVSYQTAPVTGHSRITQITECSDAVSSLYDVQCLEPVTFTWQGYSTDWTPADTVSSVENLPTAALTSTGNLRGAAIDVNNDGHTDWITAVRDAAGNDTLQTYLNDSGVWTATEDFEPPAPIFDYQRHSEGVSVSELVDLNGDGKVDWVQAFNELDSNGALTTTNLIYINNGSDWILDPDRSVPSVLANLTDNSNPKQISEFIDLNGDALPDLILAYRNESGSVIRKTWLNTQTGWQLSRQPDGSTPGPYTAPVHLIDYQLYSKGAAAGFLIDVNNDGLSDIVRAYKNDAGASVRTTWMNTGSGWQVSAAMKFPTNLVDYSTATPQGLASPIDINGDGLTDIVQAHETSDNAQTLKIWLNTGNGWMVDTGLAPPAVAWEQVGSTTQSKGLFVDVNGDGLTDFVQSYTGSSGSSNTVWRNLGDGWGEDPSLAMPIYLSKINSGVDSHAKAIMLDANGDGRADLLSSAGGSSSTIQLGGTNGDALAFPDVVTRFSDGLGNAYQVEYAPGTDSSVYTPLSNGVYPDIDVAGPMWLVAAVESAVGVSVTSRAEQQYLGKKVNLLGRGDLGFARKVALDTRSGVRLETDFSQTWPFTGSPLTTQKITAAGVVLMESSNQYAVHSLFDGKTMAVYQDLKSSTNYELNGDEIDTTTNQVIELDDFANVLTSLTTRVFQSTPVATTFTTTNSTVYLNNLVTWRIGQVSSITKIVTAPGTPDIGSKTGFTYEANGDLKTKVAEPDSALAVTDTYAYDAFGHVTSSTISAAGIPSRQTTSTYTADGRFAASATNVAGHTAYSEYHPFFGQVTRTEGPNGEVAQKLYDNHGRMIKTSTIRTAADLAAVGDHANNVIVFHPCTTSDTCPANAAYFLGVVDNEGESPETVYYDNRNREVRKQTQGFDGTSVFVDTEYDAYGRKHRVSKAYFEGASTIYWTQYEYDLLGRVTKVITPAGKEITSEYSVGKTKVTNPLGQTKTTWVNGQGKPVKVEDSVAQTLVYSYDAAGRLLTTIADGDPTTQITLEYDSFGRKIEQNDPDLGEWHYTYDALGQLVSQEDANGQTLTVQYDLLGRITQRTEAEGITQWEYDVGLNAKGKLSKVWNDQGYERTHVYDDYGRPTVVTTTIDSDVTAITTKYEHTTDRVNYVEYPSGLKIAKTYNNWGFPLAIRSTSQNYADRYLAAEANAITLADEAEQYQDNTAATRQKWLDTYEAEKDAAEVEETEIAADQRRYHSALPTYNSYVVRQADAIEQAKHFERWANSYREDALTEQRKSLINAYAAEAAIALAQKQAVPWASFNHLNNVDIWPNGGGLNELEQYLSYVLVISVGQINTAYDHVKPEDLAHTAEWLAAHAQNHGNNAQRQMNEASARFEQVKIHVAQAESYAAKANSFYASQLQVIADRITGRVSVANTNYQNASDAADQISAIDTALKAKVDLAVNAQQQAAALKNYHETVASELHWRAETADAEGKITRFLQGKHVSTDVTYEHDTGRLLGVISQSTPAPIELLAGQTAPSIGNELSELIGDLQATETESSANATESMNQLAETQALIALLDPDDPTHSPAMVLATKAQVEALRVNESIFNVDYQLNNDVMLLAQSTQNIANAIQSDFAGIEQNTNNVLIYSARVHSTIANYSTQLKALYEYASLQQTQKATNVAALGTIDAAYLQEYADLGIHHTTTASQHQARADAVVVDDGSTASNPELYGLARAAHRQKRLIVRHADVSNKRRRLNVALFAPLQHLNDAAREKYAPAAAASHFTENKMLGRYDRERFKQLEYLYRDRLLVLEATETADQDLFANDTERKALYQYLAYVNAELGEMYTDMADQTYWDGMFDGFVQSLNDKSAIYSQLAANHNQRAANHNLVASQSSEQYDHTQLGHDGTILSDTYEWDDIGNLISRAHGAANLEEAFEYDSLNRLTRAQMTGDAAVMYELNGNNIVTFAYDALGNIKNKSDVGNYKYEGSSPHAVTAINGGLKMATSYIYDANGNMIQGDGRTVDYTSFNKPSQVARNGQSSAFTYGPERQLIKEVEQTGVVPKSTLYIGSQYQKIYDGYSTTEKYHISTHGGGTVAVIIDNENAPAPTTHYLHRDHLDSIVAITNENGHVVERFYYDAFGKRYTALNTEGQAMYANTLGFELTDRGFTGHKIIQAGLIHMKGRVYDPEIGRFLSADPHIQFAGNLQSYNRYSYVNNNPLAFNDPSGYFLSKLFKAVKKLFKKVLSIIKKVIDVIKKVVKFIKENWRVIVAVVVAVVVAVYAPQLLMSTYSWASTTVVGAAQTSVALSTAGAAAVGAIAGGLSGLITTGSLSGMLKGALAGGIAGATFAYSPYKGTSAGVKIANNAMRSGLTSGINNKIHGGSFSKGFNMGARTGSLMSFGRQVLDGISDWKYDKGEVHRVTVNDEDVFNSPSLHQEPLPAGAKIFTNGILGPGATGSRSLDRAMELGFGHTDGARDFFLFVNRSNGIISDLTESLLGKVFGTSSLARSFGEILANAQGPTTVFAHSQGTIITANALNSAALSGGLGAHLTVQWNGAAILYSSAQEAMNNSGATWGPFNGGWDAHSHDFVNQVIGGNGLNNPFTVLKATFALPRLFSNTPGVSPHTFPSYWKGY